MLPRQIPDRHMDPSLHSSPSAPRARQVPWSQRAPPAQRHLVFEQSSPTSGKTVHSPVRFEQKSPDEHDE